MRTDYWLWILRLVNVCSFHAIMVRIVVSSCFGNKCGQNLRWPLCRHFESGGEPLRTQSRKSFALKCDDSIQYVMVLCVPYPSFQISSFVSGGHRLHSMLSVQNMSNLSPYVLSFVNCPCPPPPYIFLFIPTLSIVFAR